MKSYVVRIMIGVVLGMLAFILNNVWLSNQAQNGGANSVSQAEQTVDYLYFAKNVESGASISNDCLAVVSIPQSKAEAEKLDEAFVRASNKPAVLDVASKREFVKGALVPNSLFEDSTYSGESAGYVALGPFRNLQQTSNSLIVAVKYDKDKGITDPKVQKLFELLYSPNKKNLILGAVLYKRVETERDNSYADQLDSEDDETAQREPNDGDDVALDKLNEGEIAVAVSLSERDFPFQKRDEVGFLVPAYALDNYAPYVAGRKK